MAPRENFVHHCEVSSPKLISTERSVVEELADRISVQLSQISEALRGIESLDLSILYCTETMASEDDDTDEDGESEEGEGDMRTEDDGNDHFMIKIGLRYFLLDEHPYCETCEVGIRMFPNIYQVIENKTFFNLEVFNEYSPHKCTNCLNDISYVLLQ